VLKYIHKTTKQTKGQQTNMDSTSSQIEPVTLSEVLELASWDRPRSNDELRNFISTREAILSGK